MTYRARSIKHQEIEYDLIVIGAGMAGAIAAKIVALKNKKVAVIDQLGHTGNLSGTVSHPKTKKSFKITKIHGHAHFLDPWTVSVGGKRYRAHHFLIASGSYRPVPPLPGLKEHGYISAKEALNHTKLSKKNIILGGSAEAYELAYTLSEAGAKIQLIEPADRLLENEDQELGEKLESILESNGVKIIADAKSLMVRKKASLKALSFKQHEKVFNITSDEIILANPELPFTDLGLDNAKVKYSVNGGINVSNEMVTSNPHIYAAGNVTGKYMLPHVAEYEGRLAAQNMFSPLKHLADYKAVPRVLATSPEFAAVGKTEQDLAKTRKRHQISTVRFNISQSGKTNEKAGFVKIITDKKGILLGASIIAPRANEMIHELTLAIQWKIKASKIDYTMHAHSTWSQYIQECASKIICR